MTSAELWAWLVLATMASSIAIGMVAVLRLPMRAWFGCRSTYALWLLPPLALLATLLPTTLRPDSLATIGMDWSLVSGAGLPVPPASGPDWSRVLVSIWAIGVALTAAFFGFAQVRMQRRLGRAQARADGYSRFPSAPDFGPAVLGLLPARIVLPDDFETRYSPKQRQLILAHEHCHIERADLWAALVAVLIRCLFWFNPVAHWAASRFQRDQELACDATVIAQYPGSRRAYARAMLKCALASPQAPLIRTWSDATTLKERIQMLHCKPIGPALRRCGVFVSITAAGAFATAVFALQPGARAIEAESQGLLYRVDLELSLTDAVDRQSMQLITPAGQWFSVGSDPNGSTWQASFRLQPLPGELFEVQSRLEHEGSVVGEPRLVIAAGADAGIRVDGTYEVQLRVDPLGPDNDPRQ